MTLAATLMVQGTASSVGKSLLVTALCRIYARRGVCVAPFKAQNMALNAHVTADGLEIGRAQALQARACGLLPSVDMNPILLKPESDARAQVVVRGRSLGAASAAAYHHDKPMLREVVLDALATLRTRSQLVVIEGAGSPAEINLRERDLVNMFVACSVDAPVLLVADIDRGGVFAHLVGTMALLEAHERQRVKGFVINKFRGDLRLLEPGLRELEQRVGVPVLGVVPYLPELRLGDEDSLSLDERPNSRARADELDIAVIRLPRISNTDDFDALAAEDRVIVRFVTTPDQITRADLVIVPGSKSTVCDLEWLRARGFGDALLRRAAAGEPILGICGGCQMLGERILDPQGIEAPAGTEVQGLGLLAVETTFVAHKRTERVRVRTRGDVPLVGAFAGADGYVIHAGQVRCSNDAGPFVVAIGEHESVHDGATAHGCVVGTMVHGLLENEAPRTHLLAELARRKRLDWSHDRPRVPSVDDAIDQLADVVADSVDMAAVDALLHPRVDAWSDS